jgi:xylan 1,4-beta-xylosidase
MDPVGFDKDGRMYVREVSETPQWAPGVVADPVKNGDSGSIPISGNKIGGMHQESTFSSQKPGHEAAYAVDGRFGGWWEPEDSDKQPTLTLDLSGNTEFEDPLYFVVDSSRIAFATGQRWLWRDPETKAAAPDEATAFRYKIEASKDGKTFETVVDKTGNTTTRYTEFDELKPTVARFVRLTITDWPRKTPLGILEFTVFGKAVPPQK